jgi:hypothetical protein
VPALLTLAEVKDSLNIDSATSKHDVELQRYIDAALPQIEYITGPINPVQITEVHRVPRGAFQIALREPPVMSVVSVTEYIGLTAYNLTEQAPGATVSNYGFALDLPESGILRRTSTVGTTMPFLGTNVTVVYMAGLASVPADVHLAAIEDVRGLYQQTQQPGRPQYGGSPATEDGWGAGPVMLFPRLAALLNRASRTQSIA